MVPALTPYSSSILSSHAQLLFWPGFLLRFLDIFFKSLVISIFSADSHNVLFVHLSPDSSLWLVLQSLSVSSLCHTCPRYPWNHVCFEASISVTHKLLSITLTPFQIVILIDVLSRLTVTHCLSRFLYFLSEANRTDVLKKFRGGFPVPEQSPASPHDSHDEHHLSRPSHCAHASPAKQSTTIATNKQSQSCECTI